MRNKVGKWLPTQTLPVICTLTSRCIQQTLVQSLHDESIEHSGFLALFNIYLKGIYHLS
jgi:hypothetical protein